MCCFFVGFFDKSLFTGFLQRSALQGLVENLSTHWDSLDLEQSQLPNLAQELYGAHPESSLLAAEPDQTAIHEIQRYLISINHLRDSPSFSQCSFVACKSIYFQNHAITPKRYHLGNSQISFKRFGPNSALETGQVVSIVWEEEFKTHYLLVNLFSELEEVDQKRDPYHNLAMLQAKMVYQEPGKIVVIEKSMIQGHIATLAYSANQSGTSRDTLCAVAIHYGVSSFLISMDICTKGQNQSDKLKHTQGTM